VKRLTFELEFITPAFIGGANQQAELRPASFVGLLRWWWRALKGECEIEKLREEEVKIFGGIAKNLRKEEINMASPVYLRVEGDVRKDKGLIKKYGLDLIFDEKKRAFFGSHIGVGYLYYFMILPKNKRNGQEEERREFIEPGSTLKLTFIGKDEVLNHYIASLWALVFLGGVGARSRRGGGNLRVIDYEPKDLVEDLEISFTPTDNLREWLKENLKRAKELVGSPKTPCGEYGKYSTLPDPGNIDFNSVLILSPKEFNNWIEALNDIGNEFMKFRKIKNEQKNEQNKQKEEWFLDIAVFGLPLRYGKGEAVKVENTKEVITRRSSPVIIKVIKTPNDKYKWMALRLWGKFLPDGAKLRFRRYTKLPSFNLIEKFFQKFGGEVKEEGKNE
jgi:CRISPR-associated protein Cmr1